MRRLEGMQTVRAEIPAELVVAAGLDAQNLSVEAARIHGGKRRRGHRLSSVTVCTTPRQRIQFPRSQFLTPCNHFLYRNKWAIRAGH
jgi:hypothetical protein